MESIYDEKNLIQIKRVVNNVVRQFDNTGTVTLANSTTTTTVSNPKVASTSKIFLQPRTSAAASENAYISSISAGSFVITHANAATTRTFDYVVFGV
ncbi:hypothetical protein [Sinorhizobium fredii]|uniref:hypothetical protein n=1 Tax=Rhizobium fredii TaxID=380 RepID=UPI0004BC6A09|nr:hypothetical protein [Sinorhizobium fredii]AWI60347.1 hypothetical protein AB395_00005170 [Sinorhizobium fredii CCBAU 45436]